MSKPKDLKGKQYGRLKVICLTDKVFITPNGSQQRGWLCECSCEKHTRLIVRQSALTKGNTRSCGCLKIEKAHTNNKGKLKLNRYDLAGEYGIGYTNSGKPFYFDLEDYDKIKNYTWIQSSGYIQTVVYRENGKIVIKMHNLLCPHKEGEEVDHLNRQKNDNRKNNLKPKTHLDNMINVGLKKNSTSGFIGVNWREDNQKWRAVLRREGVKYNLGSFETKEEAIIARLRKEKELFGDEAPQRHLFKEYGIE